MRYDIKQLGLGGILDQAVTLTKNHFVLFLSVLAVLQIPFLLLTSFVQLSLAPPPPAFTATPEEMAAYQQAVAGNIPIFVLLGLLTAIIVYPITNAALIYAVAREYLQQPVTIGEAFRRAFSIILPLIGTWILCYLVIVLGLILLIIPGIIFALWFALATQVVVIEGVGGVTAMKRSKALMKGNIGTLFVLGILLGVIQVGLTLVLAIVPQPHVQIVLNVLITSVLTIFASAAAVVFYFSCRCKNENFDLTLLAEAIGDESPGQATAEAI